MYDEIIHLQKKWWTVGWNTNDKWFFANDTALLEAYPIWQNWWYAIVWTTDTIWIWDGDTNSWVNSSVPAWWESSREADWLTHIKPKNSKKVKVENIEWAWDVSASWTLTADKIILWDWTKNIKTSSKWIVTTLGADDTSVPTSKAVKDVTDWKQATLWFTPENVANKKTTITSSDTDYPTCKAVETGLSSKQATMTKATGSDVDTGSDDTKYVTSKAIADSKLSYTDWVETLTWKTFDDEFRGKQIATPSNPSSWYNKLYFKSDWKLYYLNSAWTETEVGAWWGWGGSYLFALAWTIWVTWTNVSATHVANWNKTITSVDLRYWTAWNWTLTVDVNKNGTTIFTTTKPTITGTNQVSVNSWTLTTTTLASGDILTIDIDWVPATTKPVDLYVRVNYS